MNNEKCKKIYAPCKLRTPCENVTCITYNFSYKYYLIMFSI